ncbi:MAG: ssDNA endonuclease and repair protein rad10 [Candelina submexicana]|nr:MAG: ssDNA endonuclease and repair protein rad10 [Candelina submexicana]
MDDDFGDDADFTAAFEAAETSLKPRTTAGRGFPNDTSNSKVIQPKPQALPSRAAPSAIFVSPRQKGNPILNNIKSLPWEYSDIPSDYILGATTCALFLSLKYHRLHPEYIYSRIRALGARYNLRILLCMVDIQNHEESLKELSKTSLVNNLTLILCWSAQEAGRYLELYKSYEHASPNSIRAHQATSYSDKLIEFITVPRSINKTDAVALVSNLGSVRAAVNARPEEVALIDGWGEKKVQQWCGTVRENFRVTKAAKRGTNMNREASSMELTREDSNLGGAEKDSSAPAQAMVGQPVPISKVPAYQASNNSRQSASATSDAEKRPPTRLAEDLAMQEPGRDDEEALLAAVAEEEQSKERDVQSMSSSIKTATRQSTESKDDGMSEGVMAALEKLRQKG